MKPELIVEAEKVGLLTIRVLDSTKHVFVHLQFMPLLERMVRLRGSTTAALTVFLDRHYKKKNHQNQRTPKEASDLDLHGE